MPAMKINMTLADVVEILGGNEPTEVQIEVRQAVASEFAKRYLGKALNAETQRQLKASTLAVRSEIKANVEHAVVQLGSWRPSQYFGSPKVFVLSDGMKDAIARETDTAFGAKIAERIRVRMDDPEMQAKLDAEVARRMDKRIEEEVNARVDRRMKAIFAAAASQ